ncbi:MAG: caspase family protein [Bryobacteraceae bacterium]|nr:caspase family protein [Bryobacteraceae bacterium]
MEGTRRAVVVGLNEYQDSRIPRLKGAVNDAREICARLREHGKFEVADEHLLIDKDATCRNIRKGISDLLWRLDPCNLTLFYFSGHGLQDSSQHGYIAPWDADPEEPFVCGIRMSELRELVLASKNKDSVVILLDCCYSGDATEGKGGAAPEEEAPAVDQWFARLDEESAGKGKVILASSGKDEKSHEVCRGHELGTEDAHDHGAFTFHLIEGLDGKASETDEVTLDGLRRYVDDQLGHDKQHRLTFFGAGLTQADQIILAKAARRSELKELLQRAEADLLKGRPAPVFRAARDLGKAMIGNPKYKGATELQARIDQKLAEYRAPATHWLTDHLLDISTDFPDLSSFLLTSVQRLSLAVIRDAPDRRRTLLMSLCDVALKNIEEEVFLGQLKAVEQAVPGAQQPVLPDKKPA